jgi:insertion element IS1 protein InsB
VVGWVVGARDEKSCRALKDSIEEEYKGCETRSDGLVVYAKVFGEKHELCGKESGETTKVEGTNNKLRQRLGYLVRKTLSATKNPRCLVLLLYLFLTQLNRSLAIRYISH